MKPFSIVLLICSAVLLRADIQTQEKDQVQFAGALGKMMSLFGGKAMREGVTDTIAVKGNRKISFNDITGTIIDLDEEKVYQLDMKAKTWKVLTFDDVRRQFEQAEERAKKQTEDKPQPASEPASNPDAKQIQIDFDLKDTGEKKNINGYDCHEVVATITVHEKDKTLEQSGGMVLTTHEWLAPSIPSMKEIADFDRRYDEKLHGPTYAAMPSADQMAAAAAMYPMFAPALGRMNAENVNMDGTPVLISMVMESVASPEQQQQQQQEKAQQNENSGGVPTSVGGLIGGFGRRAIANRARKQQQPDNTTPGRAAVMTVNHELIKATASVSAADVAIPTGFKQKN
ncbi:MAG TPA: hypothetical protein VHC90_11930 [Bryobacteraceae bacterium]|nr:hypothetical protein [Bryobacteraceae bacterium]